MMCILEAILDSLAGAHADAGVVEEPVERLACGEELSRDGTNVRQGTHVVDVEVAVLASRRRLDLGPDGLALVAAAAN
jgi:hypothetical protein